MWLFQMFRYAELAHILKCLKRQIDHVSLQNEKSFLMCRRVIHAFYISHVFYEKYINLHQLNYIFILQPNERQQKVSFGHGDIHLICKHILHLLNFISYQCTKYVYFFMQISTKINEGMSLGNLKLKRNVDNNTQKIFQNTLTSI